MTVHLSRVPELTCRRRGRRWRRRRGLLAVASLHQKKTGEADACLHRVTQTLDVTRVPVSLKCKRVPASLEDRRCRAPAIYRAQVAARWVRSEKQTGGCLNTRGLDARTTTAMSC